MRRSAPASRARAANAFAAAAGGTGRAGLQPPGDEAVGERRLERRAGRALEQVGRSSGNSAAPGSSSSEQQQAGRLGRQLEAVAERAVVLERLLVERRQRRVERVLHDARVAPRRARGDRLALVEDDAGAALGQERGERAADDAAADDRDVRRRAHAPIGVRAQQLAQLDLQLQRRERRRQALVGARRARVAPRALVDHQQHLRVARQRVGAQRADDLGRAEDHEVRRRVARRVERAGPLDVSRTSTRPPSATRAIARVSSVHAREQDARAAGRGGRVAHLLDRRPDAGLHAAGATRRRRLRQRPGGVDDRARRGHQVAAGLEAAVRRLVERLGDHAVEALGQVGRTADGRGGSSDRCA